ncbi:hypothetical protein KI387_000845 [Taxus chinensis]|uniref:Uncharacterized protein n=1 Tax=Taxus chinensis TaxID=29808 RepID=A0AA38GT52_TAXCH|nr:hypothetical protein KI387_000845 [Taxus chinensis]
MGMQCSPRFRKGIRKEEDEVSSRKLYEFVRDFDKKKLSIKLCSVIRRNIDVCDRLAAVHSASGEFAIASSKKRPHQHNLMSRVKPSNKKTTLALANYKDRKTSITGENENVLAKDVIISTEDETENILLKCTVANRVYECEEVLGSIDKKCEFPSPISVLDGHFSELIFWPGNVPESAYGTTEMTQAPDAYPLLEDFSAAELKLGCLNKASLFLDQEDLRLISGGGSCSLVVCAYVAARGSPVVGACVAAPDSLDVWWWLVVAGTYPAGHGYGYGTYPVCGMGTVCLGYGQEVPKTMAETATVEMRLGNVGSKNTVAASPLASKTNAGIIRETPKESELPDLKGADNSQNSSPVM